MAKKDEQLFGRNPDEISELALEGTGISSPDAKHYVLQPTSEDINPALGNPPEGRFLEEVLKDSDEAKGDAVDAHPEENQPA